MPKSKKPQHAARTIPAQSKTAALAQPISLGAAEKRVQTNPGDTVAWKAIALHCMDTNLAMATEAAERAVALNGDDPEALLLLGRAHYLAGDSDTALRHLNRATELLPTYHQAHFQLANIYYQKNNGKPALEHVDRAISAFKNYNYNYAVLKGNILNQLHRQDEALALFKEALRARPNDYPAWNNAGNSLRDTGRLDEALEHYKKAASLAKNDSSIFSNYITAAHYHPDFTAEKISALCKEWAMRFGPAKRTERPEPANKAKDKVLRLGMFSDGFRTHPVGQMITTALENINDHEIELYLYSSSHMFDQISARLKEKAKQWKIIKSVSDNDFAKMIIRDEIDILFDLSGHNSGTRMGTIILEPAPIIVKWVGGLINTTGVPSIDYLITDNIETPEGVDHMYTEKLIRMPDDYICYNPPSYTPQVQPLPALRNGYITFGCFNNPSKLNSVILAQWANLLNRVENSRLFLKGFQFESDTLKQCVTATLMEHGVSNERIIIEGASPHKELLEKYGLVDIALDPWPYSGGLTTCEAMVMGVPVVTMPGPTFAGRHSATHLINAQMPELVTSSWEEYIDRAIELASDLESLKTIRTHLRRIILESNLCDGKRFARNFSNAMRAIWQRYCDGLPPASLQLANNESLFFSGNINPIELKIPKKEEKGFTWKIQGKIVVIDNSAEFQKRDYAKKLNAVRSITTITFNPYLRKLAHDSKPDNENSQIIDNLSLGDGGVAINNVCLDPEYSSILEPTKSNTKQNNHLIENKSVIAKTPIQTIRIDDISISKNIDWLILDDKNNILSILKNGEKKLKNSIIIQTRINFNESRKNQSSFDEVSSYLLKRGYFFYRFTDEIYKNNLPESIKSKERHLTNLVSANAIFLRSPENIDQENEDTAERIAFILSTGFGAYDMAYEYINLYNKDRAKNYLEEIGLAEQKNKVKQIKTKEDLVKYLNNIDIFKQNTRHNLPEELIISLTSYPPRFNNLHLTIRSLLLQTIAPDKIILWVTPEDYLLLPDNVKELGKYGLDIFLCEEIGSYKKIIPTLKRYPNSFIVTADDDLFYEKNWLQNLLKSWNGDYKAIVAHRAHRIVLNQSGLPEPYKKWSWQITHSTGSDGLIFGTSGAGMLFPPESLHPEATNKQNFLSLADNCDDIWLYWMALINGSKTYKSNYNFEFIEWENSTAVPLWKKNIENGENDTSIKKIILKYGFPYQKNKTISNKEPLNHEIFFMHEKEKVNFYLPNTNDHIQKIIRSTLNFYEAEMLTDIRKRGKNGSIFIDIGANIGNHTIYFGLFCSPAKIISLEPNPIVFQTLLKNISLNQLENKVICYNMGAGKERSSGKITNFSQSNTGMAKISLDNGGNIEIVRLDDLLSHQTSAIGVIKLDVEGMELEVLQGATEILKKSSPIIYAEAATKKEFETLYEFLNKFGYNPLARFNATATYLFSK